MLNMREANRQKGAPSPRMEEGVLDGLCPERRCFSLLLNWRKRLTPGRSLFSRKKKKKGGRGRGALEQRVILSDTGVECFL